MKRKDPGKHNIHNKPLAPSSSVTFAVGGQQPAPSMPYITGPSAPVDPIVAKALVAEGHRFSEKRQFADAEMCFQKAIQINPYHAIAHNNLGFVRQQQGNFEGAIASYRTT
jgi:tetratricopeptide (TPR) repeat protein